MYYILLLVAIFLTLTVWGISVKRSLVTMDSKIKNIIAQIGDEISLSWEGIICLLNLVEKYDQEKWKRIKETVALRKNIVKSSPTKDIVKQQNLIRAAMAEIVKFAEISPDVKVDGLYIKELDLMTQYIKIVRTSTLIYNDSAAKLNHLISIFPLSLVATISGFHKREYMEVEDGKSIEHIAL